jgi:MFS family permease
MQRIRNHKNLILFTIITLLWSIFLWMTKFFTRSYFKDFGISLEEVAGYMSLGMIVAYTIWWSIAYTFKKRHIAIVAWFIAIACLLILYLWGYIWFPIFIILISIIWLTNGIWAVIKSIILAHEIQRSWLRETVVNGLVNIFILLWLLWGSYLWFLLYDILSIDWFIVIIWVLALANFVTLFLWYDQFFRRKHFGDSLRAALPNIKDLAKKYLRLLLPIWILWAVSTIWVQKMVYIWIDSFDMLPKNTTTIFVYSVVWAVIWHILSAVFYHRKQLITIIFTALFGLSMMFFLYFVKMYPSYMILEVSSLILWIFFWIVLNILEWRYFYHIWADHHKEYGSAAYGLVVNIITFTVMILVDIITNHLWTKLAFTFCGIILLLTIFNLVKFNKERHLP